MDTQIGDFDNVGECMYKVPSVTAIGYTYCNLILNIQEPGEVVRSALYRVYTSFISEEISTADL